MTKYFEYLNEFKHKVYSNDFKTLEDAKIEACVLYKQYNDQYKPSKSTIRKQEDGTIHIAKKIKLSKDINEKNEETDQIVQFKQSLVKHLSENYQNIHNILDTTTVFGTKSIKKKLEENTNENMFLKSLSTYKPSNNPKHDLANYIFVTFYKLIDDFKP